MSASQPETSLTEATPERSAPDPPPAEPQEGTGLEDESVEQERKGYPDEPTTS